MDAREIAYRAGIIKEWNDFRSVYSRLTIEDLIDINTRWHSILPKQNHCRSALFEGMFKVVIESDISVIELGCYEGRLAREVLFTTPKVSSWVGYDINHEAIDAAWKSTKFKAIKLDRWFWELPNISTFDVFVSSHTLEHFSWSQFKSIVYKVSSCKYMFIDLPVQRSWRGYRGSHVLQADKKDIDVLLGMTHKKIYEYPYKGGWATGWRKHDI